ncbi:MAG: amidase [Sporolactobacillus sp.]
MPEVDTTTLRMIASKYHLTLKESEIEDYKNLLNQDIFKSYKILDQISDPEIEVSYPRTAGYRPDNSDNPLNAWYWRTHIQHADHGKLLGKTLAIKDNVSIAKVPMMNGSNILEGYVPHSDATVVTRVLQEGGDILGKAVCESLCSDGSSFTSDTGAVLNPYNHDYSTGGSSSGSAALVASGEVDMAIGCDQAGSIRIPSAWCGIYGLKPTWGLVPYTGIFSMDSSLDHVGPMARTVKDLSTLLEVIAGPDNVDPRQTRLKSKKYTNYLNMNLATMRIGILKEGFDWANISEKSVDNVVRKSVLTFKNCGAIINEVSLPLHRLGIHIWNVIGNGGILTQMINGAGFRTGEKCYYDTHLMNEFRARLVNNANYLSKTVKAALFAGEFISDTYQMDYYAKAQNLAQRLKEAYTNLFRNYDMIVMPTVPFKATRLPKKTIPLKAYMSRATGMIHNTCVFNLTGHPALNVPCGKINGLPVGMMFVGPVGHDEVILQAAYVFEQMSKLEKL